MVAPDLIKRIRTLRRKTKGTAKRMPFSEIAEIFQKDGYQSRTGRPYTAQGVAMIMSGASASKYRSAVYDESARPLSGQGPPTAQRYGIFEAPERCASAKRDGRGETRATRPAIWAEKFAVLKGNSIGQISKANCTG